LFLTALCGLLHVLTLVPRAVFCGIISWKSDSPPPAHHATSAKARHHPETVAQKRSGCSLSALHVMAGPANHPSRSRRKLMITHPTTAPGQHGRHVRFNMCFCRLPIPSLLKCASFWFTVPFRANLPSLFGLLARCALERFDERGPTISVRVQLCRPGRCARRCSRPFSAPWCVFPAACLLALIITSQMFCC